MDTGTQNKQGGWGWHGQNGYCPDCAEGGFGSDPVEPFTDAGFAVDSCCNCEKDNPNFDEIQMEATK